MKASIKLRDDKEPLVRAKLPICVFGVPVTSGLTLGSSSELGIHVSTPNLAAGPSCRITFSPNNPDAPLSLLFKAGLGPWGSSRGACLAVSTELKLGGATGYAPSLSFLVRPRVGDFGLANKLEATGIPAAKAMEEAGQQAHKKLEFSVAERAKLFEQPPVRDDKQEVRRRSRLLGGGGGWSVVALTSLPLGELLVASVRWRVSVPDNAIEKLVATSCLDTPVLKLDKISLKRRNQQQWQERAEEQRPPPVLFWNDQEAGELSKVASMCSSTRRHLNLLHAENQVLKRTMEEAILPFSTSSNSSSSSGSGSPADFFPDPWKQEFLKPELKPSGPSDPAVTDDTSLDIAEQLKSAIISSSSGLSK